MGLQIGESVAALAAFRQVTPPPQTQEAASRAVASNAQQNDANSGTNRREQDEVLRAGFGANTVSVPGLALRTVDRNLASAREAVPSVEELRESLRERQQEVREAQRAATTQQPAPAGETNDEEAQPVRVRPESSPRVRGFEQQEEARIAREAAAAPQDGVTPPGFSANERFDILA